MSKTLSEILTAVKDNDPVAEQELRHALIAMENLLTFAMMDIRKFVSGNDHSSAVKIHAEAFWRNKRCLKSPPKKWLGDSIPENPEWQDRRKRAEHLMDKALKGQLPDAEWQD